MKPNFLLNGLTGNSAQLLVNHGFDPRILRPYVGKNGRSYVDIVDNDGTIKACPVNNVAATLRKDDWIALDTAVVKAAQSRLAFVADLRAAGLTYTIPGGMGKTVLQTETESDVNDAEISMDGLRQSANDRPEYDLVNLPLPIIYKDFSISLRQLSASRQGGSPFDVSMAELAGRKVAEQVEKLALGTAGAYAFGGGNVYGVTNFTSRLTKTFTSPTTSAWTGTTLVTELLAAKKQLTDSYHYGPYNIYVAPAWDQYLDNDFKTYSDKTLRNRILEIQSFSAVKTVDSMSNYDIVMVQMTSDVVREVIGMDVTTLQWETQGGLMQNFKVMTIMVPQVRADYNSKCGVLHGSV